MTLAADALFMRRLRRYSMGLWLFPGALALAATDPALAGLPASPAAVPAAAPAKPHASAATYESLSAEAERKRKTSWDAAIALYTKAAALAPDAAKKGRALGEVSVMSLGLSQHRVATQAACDALEGLTGAARGAHLFNLARVAEAVRDPSAAAALYQASLAVRPSAIVSRQLGQLGQVVPTVYPGPDVGKGFCQAALGPPAAVPPDFAQLAGEIAGRRQETVRLVERRPLGPQGELLPVALLCDDPQSPGHGGWIIEVDPLHRYFVAFDSLDGRASLDACASSSDQLYVGRGPAVALLFSQGHRAGYDDYRVAARDGRPAIIFTSSLDDARAGDTNKDTDLDKRGGSYKAPDEIARTVLLDKAGMAKVARQE